MLGPGTRPGGQLTVSHGPVDDSFTCKEFKFDCGSGDSDFEVVEGPGPSSSLLFKVAPSDFNCSDRLGIWQLYSLSATGLQSLARSESIRQ